MKALIFLLIGVLAFSQQPTEIDTAKINKDLKAAITKIDKAEKTSEKLDQQILLAKKKEAKLDAQISHLIRNLKKQLKNSEIVILSPNSQATKGEEYEPYIIDERYKIEFVPRKWTGRIFSKSDFKIKLVEIQ